MAVRKLKPTTPGQRHKIIGTLKKLLHQYQKSLLYMVRNHLAVVTAKVR